MRQKENQQMQFCVHHCSYVRVAYYKPITIFLWSNPDCILNVSKVNVEICFGNVLFVSQYAAFYSILISDVIKNMIILPITTNMCVLRNQRTIKFLITIKVHFNDPSFIALSYIQQLSILVFDIKDCSCCLKFCYVKNGISKNLSA